MATRHMKHGDVTCCIVITSNRSWSSKKMYLILRCSLRRLAQWNKNSLSQLHDRMTVGGVIRKMLKKSCKRRSHASVAATFSGVKSHFEWTVTRCEKGERRRRRRMRGCQREVCRDFCVKDRGKSSPPPREDEKGERVEVDGVEKVSQHHARTSDCWEKDYQVLTKQSVH